MYKIHKYESIDGKIQQCGVGDHAEYKTIKINKITSKNKLGKIGNLDIYVMSLK